METPNLKTTEIGTKRIQNLKAVDCVVQAVDTETYGTGSKSGTKAVFTVKHPDKEDPIKISTIVIAREKAKKKEIVSLGSWINLDEDQKLQLGSPLSICLQFYGASNLIEMLNKTVHTEAGTDGYLGIKAY